MSMTMERPTVMDQDYFERHASLVIIGIDCPKCETFHKSPGGAVRLAKGDSVEARCTASNLKITFEVS